jgi:four helix bundle protein
MSTEDGRPPRKPYDIRDRLVIFASDVAIAAQKMHAKSPIVAALCPNLVAAASSAASNAEEADDATSKRDFVAKERIALREVKESRVRLRVLQRAGYLTGDDAQLLDEAMELIRILAAIIRKRESGSS